MITTSITFHPNLFTMMFYESFWVMLLAFHAMQHAASASSTANTGLAPSLSGMSPRFTRFSNFVLKAQQQIIATLEKEDGKEVFVQDPWTKQSRTDGTVEGHGITAVLQRGDFLEKGAVSTTIITGRLTEERAKAISSRSGNPDIVVGKSYAAAALSLVLHSKSPMVPTFRSDIRYFEITDGDVDETSGSWFGGGADLTPYYLFDEDITTFHQQYQHLCVQHGKKKEIYDQFKTWCDDYFYLPARGEHRGVGGIFFDDLSSFEKDDGCTLCSHHLDEVEGFTKAVCETWMPSYLPIVRARRQTMYNDEQRHWQLLRRGRYIEFNMLYDRGVKFGLVPGGRIEAVMVSCPPLVAWDYNHIPIPGSEEARLMDVLKQPSDWVNKK